MLGDFGFEIGICRIIGGFFECQETVVIRLEFDVYRINRLPAFGHDFDIMQPGFGGKRRHFVHRCGGFSPLDLERNAESVVNPDIDVENAAGGIPKRRHRYIARRGHKHHFPVDFVAGRRINFIARHFVDRHFNRAGAIGIVIDFRRAPGQRAHTRHASHGQNNPYLPTGSIHDDTTHCTKEMPRIGRVILPPAKPPCQNPSAQKSPENRLIGYFFGLDAQRFHERKTLAQIRQRKRLIFVRQARILVARRRMAESQRGCGAPIAIQKLFRADELVVFEQKPRL